MDIVFKTNRLRKRCTKNAQMVKTYGPATARKLNLRLDQLRAAPNLEPFRHLPGRCHELKGDRQGQLALDLDGPRRLIFRPADDPPPIDPDGGLSWQKVTAIEIIEIEDYHG